ncbi:ABC transporter permease [Aquamicrobium soli]|jgi:NitT/TauT family transport system permease protein|uniref:ABC transporter permease n=1 Tax=Aquamicrobium soli TaxID=1811518 RepID=A0ABV7K7Z0_9HYPH
MPKLASSGFVQGAGFLAACVLLWEVAVRLLGVREFLFPAPSTIIMEILNYPGFFARNALYTLLVTLVGFAIALSLGVALAVGIVYSRLLENTLYSLLVALNSIPKVALAPLFVIWLGTEMAPKIAIAVTIAIFAIVVDTVLGLRSVDPETLNMARAARANEWQILRKIRFPSALPSLFAGMKVAISFALVGALVGEFVAGSQGLGHAILLAQGMFDTPRVFASIVILGLMGTILFYLVDALERYMLPWHASHRGARMAM